MKPILTMRMEDKQAEATLNTIIEDLYNRVVPSSAVLRAGKLDRPHIDKTLTDVEFSYAYIYAHSIAVNEASLYVWAVRRQGTTSAWTTYFSTENEIKIIFLYFNSTYDVKVMAIGPNLSSLSGLILYLC